MLKIYETYAPRANPPDANYPLGSVKNVTVPGAKDGTPLDNKWGNNIEGFHQALLADAGITANGEADKVGSSQLLDALKISAVPSVNTYSDLRSYTGPATKLNVNGRVNNSDGASGVFLLDSSDVTSADNDGTIIVTSSGKRWKRVINSSINVKWFGASGGSSSDAGVAFQKAINAFPYADILVPWDSSGYYFDTTVEEPNSASYRLFGEGGIQSSMQQVMYARTNGAIFHCSAGKTTFTNYSGFRFLSNKTTYPNARAIYNEGDFIHGSIKGITVQNFNQIPLHFVGATNACTFDKILIMFNNSYGLKVEKGAANTFVHVSGDNNDGPVFWVNGGANYFNTIYSEDCCKRNVSIGETNPEFYIIGDAPVIDGIILNSFAGNSTPPIKLDLCRQAIITGGLNKSTTAPSYTYEIFLPSVDSSVVLNGSSALRIGGFNSNIIKNDPGYATARPSIKIGKYERDLCILSPIARASFNGTGAVTINQAAGISSIVKVATGIYTISFVEPLTYTAGITIIGMADDNGGATNATVGEVLGARTANSIRVRVQIGATNTDCQFVSVVIFGTPT